MWTTPGGRFSGRLIWKDDCMNSGGLSLSSSTAHSTVAVPDRGRVPLSRAWTADRNRKENLTLNVEISLVFYFDEYLVMEPEDIATTVLITTTPLICGSYLHPGLRYKVIKEQD